MLTRFLEAAHIDACRLIRRPVSWALLVVAAYAFLAPNVDFADGLAWHDGQRIAQLIVMGIIVILGITVSAARLAGMEVWCALPRHVRVLLSTALAAGLWSCTQAALPRWAGLEWGLLLLLLVVTLGVAAGRRAGGDSADRLLIWMLFAAAAGYAVKTAVVYLTMLTVWPHHAMVFNVRDLFTGFSNVRFFGHVQTMFLPFLLLPAMWCTTMRQRVLLGAVPALWWMLVVASGTRGTWVALAIGVLAVLAFGGKAGRRWIKWQFIGLAGGLLCYAIFIFALPTLLDHPASFLARTQDITSLSLREVIWAAALGFARENPLVGVGPMHFAYHANVVAAHPHNAVLQFMAEWGVPAAICLTWVFAAGGLAFARRVRGVAAEQPEAVLAVALLAALTGAAAQAMVDGVLVMPVSQMLLALICGWALGFHFRLHAEALQCNTVEKWLGAATVFLAVSSVVYGVMPDIGDLQRREDAYLAGRPYGTLLLPRFWTQGWIGE